MKNTENYGLGKPELTEFYNVDVQNDNMDIIDAELKSHADSISNLFAAQGNTGTEISEINTRIDEVQEQAETATNIAKGRNQAHVFNTTTAMQEFLSKESNKGLYNIGDNLYIVELDVPDWWVAEVLDEVDADTGYYYKIAQLETQKVDLTNIEADIAENAVGVASINTALASAGVNSWLLADNSIPSKLSFVNLIVKGVVTFFTVTEDSHFPANYGSGVFIPMADKNVKYIYYTATNGLFYVGKVASGTVTWSEQSQKSALDAFIAKMNLCFFGTDGWNGAPQFDLMPNDDPSAQLETLGMCYLSNETEIATYNGPSDAHNCYVYAFGMNTYRYAMLAIERGTNRMWLRTDTTNWTRVSNPTFTLSGDVLTITT